jgi:hypothetical protein
MQVKYHNTSMQMFACPCEMHHGWDLIPVNVIMEVMLMWLLDVGQYLFPCHCKHHGIPVVLLFLVTLINVLRASRILRRRECHTCSEKQYRILMDVPVLSHPSILLSCIKIGADIL